jgi:hypothetical protein
MQKVRGSNPLSSTAGQRPVPILETGLFDVRTPVGPTPQVAAGPVATPAIYPAPIAISAVPYRLAGSVRAGGQEEDVERGDRGGAGWQMTATARSAAKYLCHMKTRRPSATRPAGSPGRAQLILKRLGTSTGPHVTAGTASGGPGSEQLLQ